MTQSKDDNVSLEELLVLFNQKKNELKKIHTEIESVRMQMSEILKASPEFFFQVPNKEKTRRLVLDKKMKELTILEFDMRQSINQLALKISKKAKKE